MTDPGLLQTLDYILNHSNEASIEILAEAVVRRRRDLSVFSTVGDLPDPQKAAKEITEKINSGIGSSMESMRKSVREMILRILKEHAPELDNRQILDLCDAWMPGAASAPADSSAKLSADVLLSMIDQFVSFTHGEMSEQVNNSLREQMGAWPKRYWDAFPPVIRQIVTDYLKDKITDKEFKQKIAIALGL